MRVEFTLFFVIAPLAMAVFLPPEWLFPMLFALTGAGLILLLATPGFRWRELGQGITRISWRLVFWVAVATGLTGTIIMLQTAPQYFLLIRRNPELTLMIATFYPFLSALPQELVYRPLFFRRYDSILPGAGKLGVVLNAGLFSFAHLMYWSWIVASLTFLGGLVFAYSYRIRGNFPEAVITHAVAGVMLFALGMGVFFYSGNVTRPF